MIPMLVILSVEKLWHGSYFVFCAAAIPDFCIRSYTSVSGLQAFSPSNNGGTPKDGCVPYEVLIDLRCESHDFDRLVPQTDATFQYDKFNRLRLRNNVISTTRDSTEKSTHQHLQDQTVCLFYVYGLTGILTLMICNLGSYSCPHPTVYRVS